MKIISAPFLPLSLTESPQANSLRWQALYKNPDGSYEDQTGVFKCRDYFNDIVAKYEGFDTCAYGFDTTPMKFNEEGVYVILSGLTFPEHLTKNIETISKEAESKGFPQLSVEKIGRAANERLLFIPRAYFVSSYITSLLTYLIRISHVEQVFDTYEVLITINPYLSVDNPFKRFKAKVLATSFTQPIKDVWTYVGKEYQSKINRDTSKRWSTTIHNAGCYNWHNMVEMEAM